MLNDEGRVPEYAPRKVIEPNEAKEFKRHVWIMSIDTRVMVEGP